MFSKTGYRVNVKLLCSNFSKRFFSQQLSSNTQQVNVKFTMPDLATRSFAIESNKRLSDLEAEIKKNSQVQKVEFKSWDYCKVSKENEIEECLRHPLYIRIDKMEWQLLNDFKHDPEITKNINFVNEVSFTKTEAYEGLKHRQAIYREFKDIEDQLKGLVKSTNNNNKISDDKIFSLATKLYSIKNFYLNETEGKHFDTSLNEIFEGYYNSKEELGKMNLVKTSLEKKASRRALLIILLAPLIFLLELIAIYIGTFQIYSWDITEPMTYLLSIANMVAILYYRKKIGNDGAHTYYRNRFFKKYVRKGKFDLKRYEILKQKVELYEQSLNKNN